MNDAIMKLLAGTVARGLMWATSAISAKYAVDAPGEDTVAQVAGWLVAIGAAVVATIWSNRKDKKLKAETP